MIHNTSAESGTSSWANYLDADEEILWQGRPDATFNFSMKMVVETVFSMFFTGFSVFWMAGAMQAGGVFWMFGLLFFFTGLGMLFRGVYGDTFRRKHSWYTLTNRRAFIGTDYPNFGPFGGRKLESFPITSTTKLDFRLDVLGSIYFDEKIVRSNRSRRVVKIGFEQLHQASDVYKLMREIQNKEVAQ